MQLQRGLKRSLLRLFCRYLKFSNKNQPAFGFVAILIFKKYSDISFTAALAVVEKNLASVSFEFWFIFIASIINENPFFGSI